MNEGKAVFLGFVFLSLSIFAGLLTNCNGNILCYSEDPMLCYLSRAGTLPAHRGIDASITLWCKTSCFIWLDDIWGASLIYVK